MHVLVATDGTMDADDTTRFATALAGSDGKTTVATIVRIPRRLVDDLRSQFGAQPGISVDGDAEYVGTPSVDTSTPKGWPGDDAVIEQYLGNKRIEIARPLTETIRATGAKAESIVREGDDVESDIMELATEISADVIVIGSHGHNSFSGLLGSTGAKLVRRSPVPVLVIR
ncbi:MAG: universal stress protein [Actinomycetia bacterium]|nr:universal stress protein [Actinomycetes bacterium]